MIRDITKYMNFCIPTENHSLVIFNSHITENDIVTAQLFDTRLQFGCDSALACACTVGMS